MANLVEKIELKLEEYGIEIFDQYGIENNDYVFIVSDMLIVVHNNSKEISISFQVSTKPEIAVNNTLILEEIIDIKKINVLESFAFTNEHKIVCGKKAYDLLHKCIKENIIYDLEQKRMYQNILITTKGYEC